MKLQLKKYYSIMEISIGILFVFVIWMLFLWQNENDQFFKKYSFVFDYIKNNEKFEWQYKFIWRKEVEQLCEEWEWKQMISKDVCLYRINTLMNCNIWTQEVSVGRGRFPRTVTKSSTINLFSFEETMKISKNINTQKESDMISKKCRESMSQNQEKHKQLIDEISNSKIETWDILTWDMLTWDIQQIQTWDIQTQTQNIQ